MVSPPLPIPSPSPLPILLFALSLPCSQGPTVLFLEANGFLTDRLPNATPFSPSLQSSSKTPTQTCPTPNFLPQQAHPSPKASDQSTSLPSTLSREAPSLGARAR